MSFQGKTNNILELGKRLIQADEEWRDKCKAFHDLQRLLSDFTLQQSKIQTQGDAVEAPEDSPRSGLAALFSPENVQALTQSFRVTLTDLRSTVVKEACTTLSQLAENLGPVRCKTLVRDVFPTLLEVRGSSNKVNTTAIHGCIEAIVNATPSRFVLAPVLQVLDTSKNREVRESCIHYTQLALSGWSRAVLDRFRIPLQSTIAASLSDASPKGREKARECYWKYIVLWPDEAERLNKLLGDGVKKHLKRTRKEVGLTTSSQLQLQQHQQQRLASQSSNPGPIDGATNNAYMTQLESELSSVQAQLKLVTSRLEAASAQTGDQMSALESEKSTLEERLLSQDAQLVQLRTQQSAAVAALEEEKSALVSEVSVLKSGQSEAMAQCSEKDDRMTQLESELSSVQAQLKLVTSRLEAASAQTGDQMSALESEKSTLEERLLSQDAQLVQLRTQQSAAVAALEEEKSALVSEVSVLKSGQSEAMAQCSEKDDRMTQLESELPSVGSVLSLIGEHMESAKRIKVNNPEPKPVVPIPAFSLAFSRDRAEIVDEERRTNEANLLQRRLRRQHREH
ncbi:hypothetical protein BBJ29_004891 [Phytophthora kernoviae]|uniref:TOG domain-containing protein n=1 Tax=Phytophthora kernoviae TaxID=325452 RepID=A0A3F2S135_9STRA|nr:hypothetical protein BBP00_00001663 [Phytophthora kernoviae]RLN70856.1 hypothetical protein BBJ29_004891 [Phytophthora kernoviae]